MTTDCDAETLEELRSLHRRGSADSTYGLAVLFEVMARANGAWAERPLRRGALDRWVYDRHKSACGSCGCAPRSAAPCQGPWCKATIVSVREQAPEYCSGACRARANRHHRNLIGLALIEALRTHPAGIEEQELARTVGIDVKELRATETRMNAAGPRIARTQRTDSSAFDGYRWHLALAGAAA